MTYRIDRLASRTAFSRTLAGIARISCFPPSHIARAITSNGLRSGPFEVGDRVEAEWTPSKPSRWAPATVVGINTDGTYAVIFDGYLAKPRPRELHWIRAEPSIAELCGARIDPHDEGLALVQPDSQIASSSTAERLTQRRCLSNEVSLEPTEMSLVSSERSSATGRSVRNNGAQQRAVEMATSNRLTLVQVPSLFFSSRAPWNKKTFLSIYGIPESRAQF